MRFLHGPFEIVLGSNQLDVERVGPNAGARVGDARNVLQLGVPKGVPLPAKGGNQVSGCHIAQGETSDNPGDPFPPIARSWSSVHRHRSPRGSVPGSILGELELRRWPAFPRCVSGRFVHAKGIAFAAARGPRGKARGISADVNLGVRPVAVPVPVLRIQPIRIEVILSDGNVKSADGILPGSRSL